MWWSNRYNKPLKDPTLLSYTLEELAYEYHLFSEAQSYNMEIAEEESDKIEEAKVQEDEDWANEMEREEQEASINNPLDDPNNIKWMEEEMARQKQLFGDSFGDDIMDNFEV
jgi:hypothetical protein